MAHDAEPTRTSEPEAKFLPVMVRTAEPSVGHMTVALPEASGGTEVAVEAVQPDTDWMIGAMGYWNASLLMADVALRARTVKVYGPPEPAPILQRIVRSASTIEMDEQAMLWPADWPNVTVRRDGLLPKPVPLKRMNWPCDSVPKTGFDQVPASSCRVSAVNVGVG